MTGNIDINNDTNTISVLSKLLPFLVTNGKGDFRDFANREILDRLQEQKGVTQPSVQRENLLFIDEKLF